MNWVGDDEMMGQLEGVTKDEGKMTLEKNEGKSTKCAGAHKVPELMVAQVQMEQREAQKENQRNKEGGRLVHRE